MSISLNFVKLESKKISLQLKFLSSHAAQETVMIAKYVLCSILKKNDFYATGAKYPLCKRYQALPSIPNFNLLCHAFLRYFSSKINVHHLTNLPQFFWDAALQVLLCHSQTPVCGGKCTLPQVSKFGSNLFTDF